MDLNNDLKANFGKIQTIDDFRYYTQIKSQRLEYFEA